MPNGTGGFLRPEEIIQQINIRQGEKIADFGCGAGYFTIPLARLIGEDGEIYALDILETALESVQSKAKTEGIFNIKTSRCNLEELNGSKLEDSSVDLVLVANILFQSSKKIDIIKEARRVLKPKGKMVVIDWKPNQPMGPSEDLIVSKEEIEKISKDQGFELEKEFPVDKYHWGIIFKKS